MDLIETGDLANALDVGSHELVSIVGGGGKTTTLFALGRQMTAPAIMTTTTKMGADRTDGLPVVLGAQSPAVETTVSEFGRVLVWEAVEGERATGVSPDHCDRWFGSGRSVIVEADGSRRRPFKAPADYEPVVPERTSLLVACIGASALGEPIDLVCHRSEIVAGLIGCDPSDTVTPGRAAAVLLSCLGSRKGLPSGARYCVLIHKIDPSRVDLATELAAAIEHADPAVSVFGVLPQQP